jgi:DNA-binding GntR family transcriptional regulator
MRLPDRSPGNIFAPVQSAYLAESVVAEMRRAIVNGTIPPGDRLIETDLAEQFEVSRAIIRQSLAQLKVEGLIEVRPRRGAMVTRMSNEVAREVCTVRALLEGWAARTACLTLTEGHLQTMRAMADEMGASVQRGDVYGVMELDIELHSLICRCEDNPYLLERWESLNALHGALLASRLAYYNYEPLGVVHRHRTLVDTLALRDPDRAEEAIRIHYISRFVQEEAS